jgi:hypothetical protein
MCASRALGERYAQARFVPQGLQLRTRHGHFPLPAENPREFATADDVIERGRKFDRTSMDSSPTSLVSEATILGEQPTISCNSSCVRRWMERSFIPNQGGNDARSCDFTLRYCGRARLVRRMLFERFGRRQRCGWRQQRFRWRRQRSRWRRQQCGWRRGVRAKRMQCRRMLSRLRLRSAMRWRSRPLGMLSVRRTAHR